MSEEHLRSDSLVRNCRMTEFPHNGMYSAVWEMSFPWNLNCVENLFWKCWNNSGKKAAANKQKYICQLGAIEETNVSSC